MAQKVKCGNCQKELELVEKPGDKTKLVAICDCRGSSVQVYETDSSLAKSTPQKE